jgi:5-formyltetrahydrofolate cyclo-ligase
MTALSHMSKAELRTLMRAYRRDLSVLTPGAAEEAAEQLPLDNLPPFSVIAGYHAIGSELNPWPVLRRLAAHGARIVLPVAVEEGAPLQFRAWDADQPLKPDAARVPSPADDALALTPDLVIVPLLAFDSAGFRLGQGGGYYDRTLQSLRAQGEVFVIGLGYAGQQVDQVPRDPHDQPLDAIVTETGYHRVQTKDD